MLILGSLHRAWCDRQGTIPTALRIVSPSCPTSRGMEHTTLSCPLTQAWQGLAPGGGTEETHTPCPQHSVQGKSPQQENEIYLLHTHTHTHTHTSFIRTGRGNPSEKRIKEVSIKIIFRLSLETQVLIIHKEGKQGLKHWSLWEPRPGSSVEWLERRDADAGAHWRGESNELVPGRGFLALRVQIRNIKCLLNMEFFLSFGGLSPRSISLRL